MKNTSILLRVSLVLFLSGCGVFTLVQPPVPSPTPIAVSTLAPPTVTPTASPGPSPEALAPGEAVQPTVTAAITATPTETVSPTFTPEPDWLAYAGRTEEGLMFLGNPEAPVKMIDFSDFM